MANLNKEMIHTLSKLCRIDCTESDEEALLKNLSSILSYIDLLSEVDTEGVTPCNNVLEEMTNVTRDDIVGETLKRDTFLENSPAHIGGMIRVPPVIKGHQS